MTTTVTKTEKDEAREALLAILKPGSQVLCVLRSVARSGMSRRIDFYTIEGEGLEPPCKGPYLRYLSGYIAKVLGISQGRGRSGLLVHGCGMDMGFHVVSELGYALWPNGTPKPHGKRNGEPDSSGGYALAHEWV